MLNLALLRVCQSFAKTCVTAQVSCRAHRAYRLCALPLSSDKQTSTDVVIPICPTHLAQVLRQPLGGRALQTCPVLTAKKYEQKVWQHGRVELRNFVEYEVELPCEQKVKVGSSILPQPLTNPALAGLPGVQACHAILSLGLAGCPSLGR